MDESTLNQHNLSALLQSKRLIDLSLPLSPLLPATWPGHMLFAHSVWNWYAPLQNLDGTLTRSTGPYCTHMMILDEHVGTHFDAPTHFVPPAGSGLPLASQLGEQTGDKVPLEELQGTAVVVDVRHLIGTVDGVSPWVTAKHLKDWENTNGPLEAREIVLLRTGWDQYFVEGAEGQKYVERPVRFRTFPGWPAPSVDAVEYLLSKDIRCLGIDAPSIGAVHEGIPAHQAGLSKGIRYVEGLTRLDELPVRGAYFIFLPIKVVKSSGCPGRAIAFV